MLLYYTMLLLLEYNFTYIHFTLEDYINCIFKYILRVSPAPEIHNLD